MKVKLSFDDIIKINYFEKSTRLKVKDSFLDPVQDKLVFVVQFNEIHKLLKNKKGIETIKNLEQKLGKKLRIIEFNPNPALFVKNAILPLKVDSVEKQDNKIIIKSNDRNIKSQIIGKGASNLNNLKNLVSRYFSGLDIVVE